MTANKTMDGGSSGQVVSSRTITEESSHEKETPDAPASNANDV